MAVNPFDFRKILEANNAVAQVPKPPNYNSQTPAGGQQSGYVSPTSATSSQPSPGVPQNSGYVPPMPPKLEKGNPWNELSYSKHLFEGPGASSGTQTWAKDNAQQYYGMLSPQEASMVRDMNASELDAYIKNTQKSSGAEPVSSATPAAAATAGGTGATPTSSTSAFQAFVPPQATENVPKPPNTYPTMDTTKAREYAKARVAERVREMQLSSDNALRRGQTAADQQLASMDNQMKKLKTTIGEDRSVQDVQNSRNWSPYSGRSDFAQGMLTQERSRSDREMNDTYMMNQNNVNQNVGNLREQLNQSMIALQNAAPDEEEQLYQEVIQNERNYQLALQGELRSDALANGQLNDSSFNRSLGSFNANLAAQNQQFNQGIQQGQLTGNYQGAPTLAGQQLGQQQKQSNWQAYMDSVGLTGNMGSGPKQDWGLLGGTNGSPSYQAQQSMTQLTGLLPNGQPTTPEQQRQLGNLWAVAQQTGTIPNELADLYGIPRGTQTQSAMATASTRGNQNINNLMDVWRNSGKAPAGLEGMGVQPGTAYFDPAAAKQQGQTFDDYAKDIDSSQYIQNIGGVKRVADPKALADYIAQRVPDVNIARQLFQRYQLPMGN